MFSGYRKKFTAYGSGILKAFYYQRASMALEPEYAGKWNRRRSSG
jgi:hypothetical protein